MGRQISSKLNQLLKIWPAQTVAVHSWLRQQDIYRQLVDAYRKGSWLKRIGQGAFVRFDEKVDWTGALYALQEQMKLPIHAGGKTALYLKGYVHFLPMGKRPAVYLFGVHDTKLPAWFKKHDWGVNIRYAMTKLFHSSTDCGLTTHDLKSYSINISTPERAIMEVLHLVLHGHSFEEAGLLMEGMTTLRPRLVQDLLEGCNSIKVKRLFMFMAMHYNHSWINKLDLSKVDFGKGKRLIAKGGRFDKQYQITVPESFYEGEEQREE